MNEMINRNGDYPARRLLDDLSATYDMLIRQNEQLKNLNTNLNNLAGALTKSAGITIPSTLVTDQNKLTSGSIVPYDILSIALDSALTEAEYTVQGEILAANTDGVLNDIYIRFNNKSVAKRVPIKYFNPWSQPFFKIYVTAPAQSGKTLYLAAGQTGIANIQVAKVPSSGAPETIYSAALLAAGTYYSTMVDCQTVRRVAFRITNGLDVDCTAQVIANFTDDSATADLLASPVVVATGDHASIVPAWDDWQPYMGIVLVVTAVPSSGTLSVEKVVQE
jgi:hypothetical protein